MKGFVYRFSISLLFFGTFLSCETGGPDDYKKYFIKYYGGDGDQVAKDFIVNDDGTVVMLGTFYETNGNTRLYVVKADAQGNEIWTKKIGSTSEFAQDIEQIVAGPDAGNFVILSNVKKNVEDSIAIRLTVISSEDGDSLRSSYFNFLDSQEGYSITPKADGGYFVGGKTTDPNSNDNVDHPEFTNIEDQLLIEFEPDLSYQESNVRRIGNSATGTVVKIFDNGPPYYFAGSSDEINQLETDDTDESNFFFSSFFVVGTLTPIDYAGVQDEDVNEYMSAIISNSVFYASVGTRVQPSGAKSLFAATLSSGFTVLSENVYSPDNVEGISIDVSSDGQYLIVGNEITTGGNRNIWFTRINSLDELPSSTPIKFGAANNDDTASAVGHLPNGDVLILGTMELVNQKKMALIKIDKNGSF